MLATIMSGAVLGVEGYAVRVEVDLARGLPSMSVVGLPHGAVREGRERVTAALVNSGFPVPPRRITINLAPADIPKNGSAFDLPIALGLLAADGRLLPAPLDGVCCIGELGLDGTLRPVHGALAIALLCRNEGVRRLIVPAANAAEAAVVEGVEVFGARALGEVVAHLAGRRSLRATVSAAAGAAPPVAPDFADVRGQGVARRALEVAAAGGHNLLMLGPPGSGKSMMARRLPSILPPLTPEEALEATLVHSVAGRLPTGVGLLGRRVFRAPHHAVSDAGLIGGGGVPRPGEASLAHHGVLFLDELPEFRRSALEALRQPLEDGFIHIGRARAAVRLPARFMLVAAMNPCPCGFHPGIRCKCTPEQVRRYRARISGPLLDRIDVQLEVQPSRSKELARGGLGESSERIRDRVADARAHQLRRYRAEGVFCNAQLDPRLTRLHCMPDEPGAALLEASTQRLGLSGRAFHRVLRLARTIADLAGRDGVEAGDIAEAIQYRSLDRRPPAPAGVRA
ncbi:MAG TPA: YifB family Mg chelatase-like AAA ATPase [Longimicrobiales bacterium]|nr:YifB family Mg chelatase-like AAA ATPase [Longimicrobiales bacterium]